MLIQSTFAGKLATLEQFVRPAGKDLTQDKERLLELAAEAEKQVPDEITNEAFAVLNELVGRIHMIVPADPERAADYFSRSLDAWPLAENRSICPAYENLVALGQDREVQALTERFSVARCIATAGLDE